MAPWGRRNSEKSYEIGNLLVPRQYVLLRVHLKEGKMMEG